MSRVHGNPLDFPTTPPARLRSEPRSSTGPLREVVDTREVRLGRGHAVRMTLECGHTVLHIGRRDLSVGSVTGCPHCR